MFGLPYGRNYYRSDKALTYWRSESKMEVDFVIADEVALGHFLQELWEMSIVTP